MKKILPMRFGILFALSKQKNPMSDIEIMKLIEEDYKGEGQFKETIVFGHLTALCASGLISESSTSLIGESDLSTSYVISDSGRERLKYLPASLRS
ncbi:MAG: helix-turn-helix transcriptional regulator [Oligoflexia bacterium]|nr:helix-turn-helix transcriptional regulator [Oligoflexia bacterium]